MLGSVLIGIMAGIAAGVCALASGMGFLVALGWYSGVGAGTTVAVVLISLGLGRLVRGWAGRQDRNLRVHSQPRH